MSAHAEYHTLQFLNYRCFRERVEETYQPPQIADDEAIGTLLSQHMQDYRRLYIEHPRLRLDGVYIAVCHYMYVVIFTIYFVACKF